MVLDPWRSERDKPLARGDMLPVRLENMLLMEFNPTGMGEEAKSEQFQIDGLQFSQ